MVARWVNAVVYVPLSEGKRGGGNWGGKNSGGLCLWAAPPSLMGRKLPDLDTDTQLVEKQKQSKQTRRGTNTIC